MVKKKRKLTVTGKTGFHTLADVRAKAGKLGLQDPKLRKGNWGKIPTVKDIYGKV